jgi:GT2 family glycosyltransferase
MIEVLKNNDDVGIVNPSSNSSCQFPGKLDIHTYAHTLKEFSGQFQELYRARAFAMVVKREVVDKIGYLDDIYGMGYFDDTDYSKRAQASGYKVVRAKASYVFHKESRSFSKVKEKDAIFSENEKKFSSKWGRPVRVAYVITGAGERGDAERLSGI